MSTKQLTFGVSFKHMFKVLDKWGEIADDMLYNNKYFSAEFFTNISTQYTTERRLFNPEKKHFFVLTSNNLIYTQTIEGDYDKEYELFKQRVVKYIVPEILSKHNIIVRRLGVVYSNEFNEQQIKSFSSKYFNPNVQNILDFRFSKKEGTTKGALYLENSDYINKIITVGNISKDFIGISFDYQLHFTPIREDVRDVISEFLSNANDSFKEEITDAIGEN